MFFKRARYESSSVSLSVLCDSDFHSRVDIPYSAKPKKGVQKKKVLGFDMKSEETVPNPRTFFEENTFLGLALYGKQTYVH